MAARDDDEEKEQDEPDSNQPLFPILTFVLIRTARCRIGSVNCCEYHNEKQNEWHE